jgi:hypothetical protein
MKRMLTVEEVLDACGEALGEAVTIDAEYGQGRWDSLGQIGIMIELDTRLGAGIGDLPGAEDARSVNAIVALLRKNGFLAPDPGAGSDAAALG